MGGKQICNYLWIGFGVLWLLRGLKTKPVQVGESAASRISYTVATTAAFYALFSGELPFAWMHYHILPRTPSIEVLGVVVTAAGLAFATWARAYLGGNWSSSVTLKVGHQLVRTGPYRWVRHPIYSGIILGMIGTAIERGQLRGVVAVIVLWVGFTIKSRIEERLMLATFGAEYQDYSRSTGALVPRLRF